jgi:hypothetical protein
MKVVSERSVIFAIRVSERILAPVASLQLNLRSFKRLHYKFPTCALFLSRHIVLQAQVV